MWNSVKVESFIPPLLAPFYPYTVIYLRTGTVGITCKYWLFNKSTLTWSHSERYLSSRFAFTPVILFCGHSCREDLFFSLTWSFDYSHNQVSYPRLWKRGCVGTLYETACVVLTRTRKKRPSNFLSTALDHSRWFFIRWKNGVLWWWWWW